MLIIMKNNNNNNNNVNNNNNNNNNNVNNNNNNNNNPEVQYRIHNGSPITPILSRINPIPHIDTYFFKIHSNIVFPSTPRSYFL